MEWDIIAKAATAILLPYFSKAGEASAKKIGEDLYKWLKGRFKQNDDPDAEATLEQLKRSPDSEPRRAVMIETLSDRAASDPTDFGMTLRERVEEVAQTESPMGHFVNQVLAKNVNIIQKNVGDIYNM